MPNDSSHLITNFAVLIALLLAHQLHPVFSLFQQLIFAIGYFIGTVYLSPDIDTKSEPLKRCGVACKPYSKVFSHRKTSHGYVSGAFSRVLYVLIILIVVAGVMGLVTKNNVFYALELSIKYWVEIVLLSLGLFASNAVHIVWDGVH